MHKIGILGGSFDPIHYGHLVAANVARDTFNLEKVIFVPVGTPPHKLKQNMAAAADRVAMVRNALVGNKFFTVSDLEIKRSGKSYTLDTLKEMRQIYPEARLYLILGADAFCEFHTWHRPEDIILLCDFIVVGRYGCEAPGFNTGGNAELNFNPLRIHFLDMPRLEISSNYIRARCAQRLSVRYLTPDAVIEYIKERGIYLPPTGMDEIYE